MRQNMSAHERIIHRLKISQGHLKKVIEMAENDEYCIDIVHQSQAVQQALHEIDMMLIQDYLQKSLCAEKLSNSGKENLQKIMEIIRKAK